MQSPSSMIPMTPHTGSIDSKLAHVTNAIRNHITKLIMILLVIGTYISPLVKKEIMLTIPV